MSRLLSSSSLQAKIIALLLGTAFLSGAAARAQPNPGAPTEISPSVEDQRPLSAAQRALFETPHLQNVRQPETINYEIVRSGETGFTDNIAVHIRALHADGSKDVSFDFMSGAHRVAYPELDQFRGNPLLMLVLERDVLEMKATLGLSAAYFRNRIRQSFVDQASIADTTVLFGGQARPGRIVTVRPFAGDDRLSRLPTVQDKTYVFVLAEDVPGGIAELRINMPGDPAKQLPAFAERIAYLSTNP